VREQALTSSSGAQDFGGLFIGFSFFLIAAAVLLTSLLFKFALEQRGVEIGTLLAIGFVPKKVRRLLLLEGLGLAVVGGIIGVGAAVLYARAMLYGLSTIWSGAVAGADLAYHGTLPTMAIGFASGVIIAVATIWWALRRETKRTAREMLAEGFQEEGENARRQRPSKKSAIAGFIAGALGLATAGWGLFAGEEATADTFFSAGALVLIGGLLLSSAFIRRLQFSSATEHLSLFGMGVRSIARRRQRSRAAIGLLACGAFLIASIGAFHLDAAKETEARGSGAGGFALIGDSSLPIVQNLNAKAGRDFYGLSEGDVQGVSFVPFRVLQGEDASCLNLNRALKPRLLGVNPSLLGERHAFTFSKVIKEASPKDGWDLLNQDFGANVVPAIGDEASIQWALGKSIGDTLTYLDASGREFQVKIVGALANSILQGSLVISEEQFVKRFPTEAGYRMFLVDAPSNRADAISATLMKAMQDAGFEATSARERLAAFNAVQNTYLGTFQMLGGLGLLLGTFGLGVILLRNVFERRGELALLLAVGFRRRALRRLILSEHAALLLLGLLVGVMAAVVAVLPSMVKPGARLPYGQLVFTLGAVFLCGLIWTTVAAVRALRAPLLQSLRNE
ncbi:MAG TPA: ABC transporter permease, partial [Verrucomicrobiae bacterium]|nr:ABC transporter permease [Verrucomicrobiae bacterium]